MKRTDIYSKILEKEYTTMNDEEIITLIKDGDKEALDFLITKYKDLVYMKVNNYYMIGAEKDDIIQEGLIGLFKAIKCYMPDRQNTFRSFANLCIERQIITAIKSSNRQKHSPLNSYLSLNTAAYENDEEDGSLLEVFNSNATEDPLDALTRKEYFRNLENTIDEKLSLFEKKVLQRYLNGESYVRIAEKLNTPVKSIDNAIQRIRKKTNKNFNDN